jgi:hypothetical protein
MRHVKASKTKLLMTLAAALTLAACQTGSFIHNIDLSAAGTYQLKLINNNQTLPYTTGAGNQQVTITSETMLITDAGDWNLQTIRSSARSTGTVVDTLNDGGTYTKNQTSLTLHSTATNSTAFTGSFSTNTLQLTGADGTFYIFGT